MGNINIRPIEKIDISKEVSKSIQEQIDYAIKNVSGFEASKISDGCHTFDELYEFRKMYNAALFNEWANFDPKYTVIKDGELTIKMQWSKLLDGDVVLYDVHKSWRHYDGELCFGGGWFIVSAMLPTGLISNHYKEKDWDLFKIPEVDKAKYEFDGHTGKDVLERLKNLYEDD